MKKLRKSLALIMALVMLSGLFVFAGPAAVAEYVPYADQAQVDDSGYDWAVEMFTLMGVITGEEEGGALYFRPDRGLMRREAAAWIARTLTSNDAAGILDGSQAPYSDVAAGQWFTGPIAFAKNRGIIAGIGNNMFDPTATLTKVQWTRILLSALGWGQNGEFEGAGWALRVYETATNTQVNLFNTHGWGDGRLTIPEAGMNADISRAETIALLYNAVLHVHKVQYDRAADTYYVPVSSPGLGGTNFRYIYEDVGLGWGDPSLPRDRYGRAENWSQTLYYRGEAILTIPLAMPELIAEFRGNDSGTHIRTVLQGIPRTDGLSLAEAARIFVNHHEPQEDIVTTTTVTEPVFEWLPVYTINLDSDGRITGITTVYEEVQVGVRNVTSTEEDNAYLALEAYLRERGNDVAFGPSVTIEVYQHNVNARETDNLRYYQRAIEIVFIENYLVQYSRRVSDDPRTIRVNESAVEFDLFHVAGARATTLSAGPTDDYATGSGAVDVRGRGRVGLENWSDFFDNPSLEGNYYIATVRGVISAVDGIVPNTGANALNEVKDPTNVVRGLMGNSSITRATISGTGYDMGLDRPTIRRNDTTNNYDFYLDENDVIIGAVYARPNASTMDNLLFLTDTLGRAAKQAGSNLPANEEAFAVATFTTGAGQTYASATLNHNPRGGSTGLGTYRNPDPNGTDQLLPQYDVDDDALTPPRYGADELDAFDADQFYTFTQSGGVYTLRTLDPSIYLQINQPDIRQGIIGIGSATVPAIGTNPATTRSIIATSRTILTVVDATRTGRMVYVGVNSFPNLINTSAPGFNWANYWAVVKLEPGNPNNVAAEILFVSKAALTNLDMSRIGYLYFNNEEPIDFNPVANTVTASFIVNDTDTNLRVTIVNPANVNVQLNRFYYLERDNAGEWRAYPIGASALGAGNPSAGLGFPAGKGFTLRSGYITEFSSAQFTMRYPNDAITSPQTLSYISPVQMPVISVRSLEDGGAGEYGAYLSENAAGVSLVGNRFVVTVVNELGNPVVMFVLSELADRTAYPGLEP